MTRRVQKPGRRLAPCSPRVALAAVALLGIAVAPLPAASAPRSSDEAKRFALEYLRARAPVMGLTQDDIADVGVTDLYPSEHNGVTHVYLVQRYRGIEVAGARMTLNVTASGGVLEVGHRFLPSLASRVQDLPPRLSAGEALSRAKSELGSRELPSSEPQQAKLVYQPVAGGGVRLAWELAIEGGGAGEFSGNMSVDARTGQVLERTSWRSDIVPETAPTFVPDGAGGDLAEPQSVLSPDSYQVFAIPKEHPDDGPRTVEANPAAAGGAAAPFGWHDTNGAAGPEFTITRGNFVHAYLDIDHNNVPDAGSEPSGGAGNDYLFPLDLTQAPTTYRPAAVTNAFYWANVCHDVLWNHGFTEAAGNFQANNYGRGGQPNDALLLEVQDGSGTNNANLTVGADGSAPRMQLFLFNLTAPARDAALASGIVSELYFFGTASRLVGGPAAPNCLNAAESGGMQWGWADWFDLVMTAIPSDLASTPRGIGTYLLGQPSTSPGFRPKAYSTDFGVNNFTYGNIPVQTVQTVGAVWGTMLWDLYWELVSAHGFNPNLHDSWSTGGNILALQLILDAMKLVPCNPGFVDGRNAILIADQALTGGANRCAIWRAFARRGLGSSASQGLVTSLNDGVQAFDFPLDCQTAVEDDPRGFDHALEVHPNPFDQRTRFSFALAVPSRFAIEVFDLHGRRVRRIASDLRAAGRQEVAWDGRGEEGRPLGSGEYLVRLVINGQPAATKKAMRIR